MSEINVTTADVTNVKHGSSTVNTLVFGSEGKVTCLGTIGSVTTLSSSSGTATADMDDGNNFKITLSENTTLANPTNVDEGQSGVIFITQDSTDRTLAFGSNFKFPGGTAPTVSTGSGTVDALVYTARSSSALVCQYLNNV